MAVAVADPNKKYISMENVLIDINRRVISLQEKEKKRNNVILGVVVDNIISTMKQKDHLFGRLFREKFYGGSYYDNLKVGDPNEFDLDLILFLPIVTEPRIKCSSQPGFVRVEVKEHMKILSRPDIEKAGYDKLSSLLESKNFLSTKKVLIWMEAVINKAINELNKDNKGTYMDAALDKENPDQLSRIYAKIVKGAPAFTLKLAGKEEDDGTEFNLDIDLVPCFQFDSKNWPDKSGGYRTNPSSTKGRFLVVPKKPKEKHLENAPDIETYWRLSFQEQERDLIGDGKKFLKPSLRILKKLRDKHNHKIASYFIKTVYLWTVEKEPATFWDQPLSVTVMLMLKKYEEYLRSNTIPYYWNQNYNLIGYLKDTTKLDIANTILNIIGDVDRNLAAIYDPYVIGKYLLPKDEFEKLKSEVKLGKKPEKQIRIANTQKILNSPVVAPADSTTPPLIRLGFDTNSVEIGKQLSAIIEKNNRKLVEDIVSQIGDNSSSSEIVNLLKNIDEKMDKMAEKVANLEDKLEKVELENQQLRVLVNENSNSMTNNAIDSLKDLFC